MKMFSCFIKNDSFENVCIGVITVLFAIMVLIVVCFIYAIAIA